MRSALAPSRGGGATAYPVGRARARGARAGRQGTRARPHRAHRSTRTCSESAGDRGQGRSRGKRACCRPSSASRQHEPRSRPRRRQASEVVELSPVAAKVSELRARDRALELEAHAAAQAKRCARSATPRSSLPLRPSTSWRRKRTRRESLSPVERELANARAEHEGVTGEIIESLLATGERACSCGRGGEGAGGCTPR